MGSFANMLFSILLGWLQPLIASIWSALFSAGGNRSFLQWIGQNWKGIALTLCLIGCIADLLVYMFRWQPYKVWKNSLKKDESDATEENDPQDVYSGKKTGGSSFLSFHARNDNQNESERTNENPTETGLLNQVGTSRPRRRLRINMMLNDEEEELYHFNRPKSTIEQKDAYHAPVFPQNWGKNGEKKT